MIIIGDVHGCLETLKSLLDKIPQSEKDKGVCFVGDLIDRGPNSRGVVEFVRLSGYQCVMGNHEQMMIDEYKVLNNHSHKIALSLYGNVWLLNGGVETLRSYQTNDSVDSDAVSSDIKWMERLPTYLEFKSVVGEGRHLVVSHSHIINCWHGIQANNGEVGTKYKNVILWDRPYNLRYVGDIFSVIGHTPNSQPKIKKTYANIDTGCVFSKEKSLGHLTALQFPEMIIYQQENIDHK
ncbi:MAG TPA: metallophosphoesterase [Patescibacteria group bacterium]|nr:metallophosphoesterase [Patescibacteria group bacterium]